MLRKVLLKSSICYFSLNVIATCWPLQRKPTKKPNMSLFLAVNVQNIYLETIIFRFKLQAIRSNRSLYWIHTKEKSTKFVQNGKTILLVQVNRFQDDFLKKMQLSENKKGTKKVRFESQYNNSNSTGWSQLFTEPS